MDIPGTSHWHPDTTGRKILKWERILTVEGKRIESRAATVTLWIFGCFSQRNLIGDLHMNWEAENEPTPGQIL